jgi:hypothetical protein
MNSQLHRLIRAVLCESTERVSIELTDLLELLDKAIEAKLNRGSNSGVSLLILHSKSISLQDDDEEPLQLDVSLIDRIE